jgi:transposase-like protein
MRKNLSQVKALNRAYQQCKGTWSREDQIAIAKKLGLTEQQVYKWSWDQLQKKRGSGGLEYDE